VSANLDLVRLIVAEWERGDYSSAEWAHSEIEFGVADGPDPRITTGLAGMAENFRGFLSAWEDFRADAEEYRELDDERVLVLVDWSGHGKTSGLELGRIRTPAAALVHVRDGKVVRLVLYIDRERALADLGLPPEQDVNEAGS
jgi:ketosteroid isomerase-like protein